MATETANMAAAREKLAAQARHLALLKREVQALLDDARAGQDTRARAHTPAELAAPPKSGGKQPEAAVPHAGLLLHDVVSPRAVRERLDTQAREIVGLQRTVRWFQERRVHKCKAEKAGDGGHERLQTTRDRSQAHHKTDRKPRLESISGESVKKPVVRLEVGAQDVQAQTACAPQPSSPRTHASPRGSSRWKDVQGASDITQKSENTTAAASDVRRVQVADSSAVQSGKETFVPHTKMENYYKKSRPKGQYRKYQLPICISEDCDRLAVATCAGYCFKHAAERGIYGDVKCTVQGCKKRMFKDEFCWKHACERGLMESPRCAVEGCDKQVQSKRVCFEHGGGTRCKHPGCFKGVVARGFCSGHRDQNLCKHDGCKQKGMLSGERKGYCVKHGGGLRCKLEGCTSGAKVKGFCRRHFRMVNEADSAANSKSPRGVKQKPRPDWMLKETWL